MKSLISCIALAVAVLTPAVSFAQTAQTSSPPVTRAEVLHQLVQLEQAGYRPSGKDNRYPGDLQAAEARVAAEQANTAVGGTQDGMSQSGQPGAAIGATLPYEHH
jgi:hypothetical protein